jgi:hypothetical protein
MPPVQSVRASSVPAGPDFRAYQRIPGESHVICFVLSQAIIVLSVKVLPSSVRAYWLAILL